MADVDDFFSRRDKKKKGSKKFDTADDVAKILEQNAAKRKVNDSKSNYVPSTAEGEQQPINEYRQQDEDDEWKEVVEKQPDLTNLKIQELILEDEDEFEGKESEGKVDTELDEKGGPWNQQAGKKRKEKGKESENLPEVKAVVETGGETNTKAVVEDDKVAESTSEDTPSTEPAKTTGYIPPAKRREAELVALGKSSAPESSSSSTTTTTAAPSLASADGSKAYVPPSRRGQAAGASSSSSSSTRSTKKPVSAPNIENEEAFPTLS